MARTAHVRTRRSSPRGGTSNRRIATLIVFTTNPALLDDLVLAGRVQDRAERLQRRGCGAAATAAGLLDPAAGLGGQGEALQHVQDDQRHHHDGDGAHAQLAATSATRARLASTSAAGVSAKTVSGVPAAAHTWS